VRKHLNDYVFSPLSWLLTIFIIILIILVLTFVTPFGVKTLVYLADSSFKELSIKGVSGSLLAGLHVDEIIWDDQGDSISLSDVDLDFQHYNTRRGRLVANKIRAGRLNINLSNKLKKKAGEVILPDFGLPLNINAHLLQLDSLQITKDVSGEEESRTLLFQIKDIELKKVTVSDGKLRFRRLSGKPIILDQPLNINVTEGKLNMDYPHEISTSGSIDYKHPEFGNIEGNIELAGTLTNYNFKGSVNHQQKKLGLQTINFLGEGDYKRVYLEKITLDGEHGVIEAKGRAVFAPDVSWGFKVDGKGLSTKKFLSDWPATVDADLRLTGSYIDGQIENDIHITSVEGILREYNLKLTGDVTEKSGSIDIENMDLQLGDNHLQITGQASEPFNLKWQLDAQNIKQMLPNEMADLKIAGSIKGNGTLRGNLDKPEVKIAATANGLVYEDFKQGKESLELDGELALEGGVLQLRELRLKSGINTVKASGQASEPFNLKWEVDAKNLKQISPRLEGETILAGQIKGKGTVTGALNKPELKVKLAANNLVFKDVRQGKETLFLEGDLGLNRTGSSNIIQLKDLILKSGKNALQITGQASEPLKLDVKLKAETLAEISPDIDGSAIGSVSILGSYKSIHIKGNLNAANLRYKKSRLSESEIRAQGEIQLIDGAPIIKTLTVSAGTNQVKISGKASSPYDLNWNIDGKNLNQIMPGLSGYFLAKGKLGGTIDKPILNATVDAKKIQYENFKLGSADVVAQTNNGIYKIKGNLQDLQSADQKITKATVDINGRIESHTITASADHNEGKISLKANGGWLNSNWKGILQSLQIKETQAGDWRLQKPTQISISEKSFSSGQLCLSGASTNKGTSVCSTTSWSDRVGLAAKGSLSKTPLNLFKPWLPKGLSLNGSVSGSYDIKQNNGKPVGVVKLTLPNSNFSFEGEEGDEKIFGYKDAEITATVNDRQIQAKAKMNIVNRGKLAADMSIKLSPENGKHTINGTAIFDVPNINWAQEFIPRSRGLRGSLSSKLSFSGLLSKPQVTGKIDVNNAYLRLPEAGTELTNINLKVRASKPGEAIITGQMLMGKGVLNVSGNLNTKDITKWKATVKITGNNILFMNTNEIKARMTPDLTIGITPKVVSFEGKILIPEATIKLKKIPEISIDETSDAYVIGERKPGEQVSAVKIQPNIFVELGDKVRFDAFGLDAKLSGSVNVTHNRRDILANGSLKVSDGKFEAYGQELAIDNGRLIFNGSPKQIGMDVRATRKVDETVVGIHLGGTLLSPKSTIYSDPTMPESEALSLLLTGHSLSASSGAESALLMSAVRGLGINGNDSLIRNIGSSLGLDDVNIVSGQDLNQSKLQLGKQLGSKLYVKYLIGLFDQTQKISLEYKINKIFSLETQISSDNNYGLDFIYEIERD
jgi:translocation and assembly module TamB